MVRTSLKLATRTHLSRGYTCNFLLALATRHPQSCSTTEVEDGQVSPTSPTCCKKLNSSNIVPAILLKNLLLATRATSWFHNSCNIKKSIVVVLCCVVLCCVVLCCVVLCCVVLCCVVASDSKYVPRVAPASAKARHILCHQVG